MTEVNTYKNLVGSDYEPKFEGMKIVFIQKIMKFSQDIAKYEKCSKALNEYKKKKVIKDLNIDEIDFKDKTLKDIEELKDFKKTLESYRNFEKLLFIFKKDTYFKNLNDINKQLQLNNTLSSKNEQLVLDVLNNIKNNDNLKEFLGIDLNLLNTKNIKEQFLYILNLIGKKFNIHFSEQEPNLPNLIQNLNIINLDIGFNYEIDNENKLTEIILSYESKFIELNKNKVNNPNFEENIAELKQQILINIFKNEKLKQFLKLNELNLNDINCFNEIVKQLKLTYNNFKKINGFNGIKYLIELSKQINNKNKLISKSETKKQELNNRLNSLSEQSEKLEQVNSRFPQVIFINNKNDELIDDEKHLNYMQDGERRWFVINLGGHYCSIAVEKVNGRFKSFVFDANSAVLRNKCFKNQDNKDFYVHKENLQIMGNCETWALNFPFIMERLINFNDTGTIEKTGPNEEKIIGKKYLLTDIFAEDIKDKGGIDNNNIFNFIQHEIFDQIMMFDEHMNEKIATSKQKEYLHKYENNTFVSTTERLIDYIKGKDTNTVGIFSGKYNAENKENTNYMYKEALESVEWLRKLPYEEYLEFRLQYEYFKLIGRENFISIYQEKELSVYEILNYLIKNNKINFNKNSELNVYENLLFELFKQEKFKDEELEKIKEKEIYENIIKAKEQLIEYIYNEIVEKENYDIEYINFLFETNIINTDRKFKNYKVKEIIDGKEEEINLEKKLNIEKDFYNKFIKDKFDNIENFIDYFSYYNKCSEKVINYFVGKNGKLVELFGKLKDNDKKLNNLSQLINEILINKDLKDKGINYLFGENGKFIELFDKLTDNNKNLNNLLQLINEILTNKDLKDKGINYLFGENGQKIDELIEKCNNKQGFYGLSDLITSLSKTKEGKDYLFKKNGKKIDELIEKCNDKQGFHDLSNLITSLSETKEGKDYLFKKNAMETKKLIN